MTSPSPDLEFQERLYSRLAAAVSPVAVEAHPPHERTLPFVQIGESQVSEHPAGHEIIVTIDTWSSAEGSHECKQLQQKIRDGLHAGDEINSTWRFLPIREIDCRVILDVDNETWHGIQRIRVLAVPVTI